MPNNELQELLGARFDRYTHTTDESVWTAIEVQLDAEKSDRIGFWFWIFNGLAATVLIGVMMQSTFQTERVANSHVSQTSIQKAGKAEKTERSIETKSENQSEIQTENQTENQTEIQTGLTDLDISSSKKTSFDNSESQSLPLIERGNNTFNEFKIDNDVVSQDKTTIETAALLDEMNKESMVRNNSDYFARVNQISTHPIASSFNDPLVFDVLPNSIAKTKLNYFKLLPIHLGTNLTYLHRTRITQKWASATDTSLVLPDEELLSNRHFEFSIFSQFDLTKRFSASVGVGYSSSSYSKDFSSGIASTFNSELIKSTQRLFVIPVQVKYAFIQKKRFGLSVGLSAQGEFGRNSYFSYSAENWVTVSTPQTVTNASLTVSTQNIRQFALEPFIQLSYGISPRISLFTNFGYRTYLKTPENAAPSPVGLNYLTTDFGVKFRIH